MNSFESVSKLRVRYHETDQMGVGWHGNYVAWFEVARTDWLRQQGMSYKDIEVNGILLPVLRVVCNYVKAVRYDDSLEVAARLKAYNGVRLSFHYRILSSTGAVVATGETEHVWTDASLTPIRFALRAPQLHRLLLGDTSPDQG